MKTKFLLVILLAFSHLSKGQSLRAVLFNPNVYRTQVNFKAVRLSHTNGTIYNNEVLVDVEGGFMDYKVVSEDENGYMIIRILPKVIYETYNTADGLKSRIRRWATTDAMTSMNDGSKYFLAIKSDDFPPTSKTLLSTKIVGVPLIHPFKLRPDIGGTGWELQQEFTVSYSFGVQLRSGKAFTSNYWTVIPYGFGIGEEKYFKNPGDDKEDGISITYYQAGLIRTWRKVNFGAFIAFDAMIDKRKDWRYQGQKWFSFGIGYKFNEN